MINGITCTKAIEDDYELVGRKLPVIDAYASCQLNCLSCFQRHYLGWNRHILVKTNLSEVLIQELADWDLVQVL